MYKKIYTSAKNVSLNFSLHLTTMPFVAHFDQLYISAPATNPPLLLIIQHVAIHYTASHFCFSGPRSTAVVNYAIIKQTAGNDTCNDATNASKGSTIGVNTSTITLSLWLCVLPHRNEVIFSKPPQHQSPKQTYCRKSIDQTIFRHKQQLCVY